MKDDAGFPYGEFLYSVRMRAAGPDGRHLSGAERITFEADVWGVGTELLGRALQRGEVATANLAVDRRPTGEVHRIPCHRVVNGQPGIEELRQLAAGAGVDQRQFDGALSALESGALP